MSNLLEQYKVTIFRKQLVKLLNEYKGLLQLRQVAYMDTSVPTTVRDSYCLRHPCNLVIHTQVGIQSYNDRLNWPADSAIYRQAHPLKRLVCERKLTDFHAKIHLDKAKKLTDHTRYKQL